MQRLILSQKIPSIALKKTNGKTVSLNQFRGKPLLLIFLRHLA